MIGFLSCATAPLLAVRTTASIAAATLIVFVGPKAFAADGNTPGSEGAFRVDHAAVRACMASAAADADASMTLQELKELCAWLQGEHSATLGDPAPELASAAGAADANPHDILDNRFAVERLSRANRFLLTPHKRNYLLPISYHDKPNSTPYVNANSPLADLAHVEAEFQFSIKILVRERLLGDNGHLYVAYTNHSFWQVYSETDSAPFRETNHEPELVLSFHNDWRIFGVRNALNELVLVHQSNGQGGLLSRSWNRLMLRSVFAKGNFAMAVSSWYRLPEDAQEYPGDPNGDDNPNITDYLGYFEANGAYELRENIFSVMLRNSFAHDNATVELGWSFPVSSNTRGYLRYFNGYGYSLIDYNAEQQVFSLGVMFTDLF